MLMEVMVGTFVSKPMKQKFEVDTVVLETRQGKNSVVNFMSLSFWVIMY